MHEAEELKSRREFLQAEVTRHVKELAEHVDSVRIFVSFHEDKPSVSTITVDEGAGNFCAQKGQIVEWVNIQTEFERCYARIKDRES